MSAKREKVFEGLDYNFDELRARAPAVPVSVEITDNVLLTANLPFEL